MIRRSWFLAAAAAVLVLQPGFGGAQDTDPVVATVNGETIVRSELLELAENLPAEYRAQLGQVMPMLIEQLVNIKLVALAAQDAGLGDDDEVLRRTELRKLDIMRDVYLERFLGEQLTDEKLQARYQSFSESTPPVAEVHARHILLESEADAREVIVALEDGADFAELAQSRSTGPSAASGGDLGYFTQEQMVPEFATAAFAMTPGNHSAEPVQSQFGWHVIKVEDRRDKPAPAFAEVEEELRRELSREVVSAKIAELREGAEIDIVDPASLPAPGAAGSGTQ